MKPTFLALTSALPSSSISDKSWPFKKILPVDVVSRPAINPSSVDFPAPEAPTIATDSPLVTIKSIFDKIVNFPSGLVTVLLTFLTTNAFLSDRFDMKKLFFYLCFIVFVNPNISDAKTSNIIIFGDSLSAGYGIDIDQAWPTLLQQRLTSNNLDYRIINASISGETTEGGITRIESILNKYTPKLIILELGGNDGLRGFPHPRIKGNLDKIIKLSLNKNSSVLLLGIKIPPNYGPRYTTDFENIYSDIAHENNIPLIEFFMENVALDNKLMQDDGIHPNEMAQPILLRNIWDTLLPLIQ